MIAERARASVRTWLRNPDASLFCSHLARLECRVGPLRAENRDLLDRYDAFFRQTRVRLAEVTASIIDRATILRARYGFGTPDAIHLATAIDTGAEVFLTGDGGLVSCPDLRVETIEEESRSSDS